MGDLPGHSLSPWPVEDGRLGQAAVIAAASTVLREGTAVQMLCCETCGM